MKKKINFKIVAVLLSGTILFSSCIGSFSLFNKVLAWNNSVGDKLVNELVFIALCVIPVYGVALFADAVVFNTIEFWTDENPMADASIKTVTGEDGQNYTIATNEDGYTIEKEGTKEVVEFIFDKKEKTWSLQSDENVYTLMQVVDDSQVIMFMPDGSKMPVSLDQAGVLAFKNVAQNKAFYALN